MSTLMLMEKLRVIDEACSPHRKQQQKEEREKNLDDFTKEKRAIAETIRGIRQDLKERDRLLIEDRKQGVVKSAQIRKDIERVRERADELDKMHKTKHKKLKQKEKIPGVKIPEEKKVKDNNRKKIIDFMWHDLKELENKEKMVSMNGDERMISESSSDGSRDTTGLGIVDMDDPQFEMLKENDKEIDKMLDVTHERVKRIKQLAIEIGGAVEESNVMIEQLCVQVDLTLGKLETVNGQLKKTLAEARSSRDFCCDIILCCLILGIITAIYFVVTK